MIHQSSEQRPLERSGIVPDDRPRIRGNGHSGANSEIVGEDDPPGGSRATPVLEEAARILSDRQERCDERIEGYVSALARDQSDPEGRATIKAVIDGALVSVKADFSQSEYNRIADAHTRRLSVSLEGDLRREGQRWQLMNPRDLTLIEDED